MIGPVRQTLTLRRGVYLDSAPSTEPTVIPGFGRTTVTYTVQRIRLEDGRATSWEDTSFRTYRDRMLLSARVDLGVSVSVLDLERALRRSLEEALKRSGRKTWRRESAHVE